MKTAVVTGASGFIGKALTKKLLELGYYVYVVVRNKSKISELIYDNLNVIELDANNYDKMSKYIHKDVDVFYHLVWEGGMDSERFKDYELQLKNAIYSCSALNEGIKFGIKKFILVSTINEIEIVSYFNMSNIKPRYTCIYSASKFAAEMICKTIAFQNNIDLNVALLANSYGIGDTSNTLPNVLFKSFIKGFSPKLVEGNFYYDLVYIDDIIDALISIENKGINQKNYYVGHRKLKKFKDLVMEIKEIINPKIELKFGELRDSSALDYSFINLDELYEDTGYEVKSNFEESILNTIKHLKIKASQKINGGGVCSL
ncbi:MAG: NAD-dependent epimerase/dehydratase family protein [Peptoanaerobacter stomatis]|uniref:NAD-dependent epimerase/dehydratase family protein n=1 Tax=Peptoanaerobacter stomatis TaxID=796937 RepID=UPI003F9FCD67